MPIEATFRFRVAQGDAINFLAMGTEPKSLLESDFTLTAANQASITARADGEPMTTDHLSYRAWCFPKQKPGSVNYAWRFPKTKNIWEERDRKEIGAAYSQLLPFEEKIFTLRMILRESTRQLWLDDRLVAEEQSGKPG